MNSVERVKSLCRERKIPISKLEKDLGYANGYIGQLRKGAFPDDRLVEIAKYLDVSIELLLGSGQKEKSTPNYESGLFDQVYSIFEKLSPDNRAKLLELADLFLNAQNKD